MALRGERIYSIAGVCIVLPALEEMLAGFAAVTYGPLLPIGEGFCETLYNQYFFMIG